MRARGPGSLNRTGEGEERVVVYQRLGSVRWYLVVEAVLPAPG